MLKLASYSKEFTPKTVAQRAYKNEGIKAIGWNGYIAIKERNGFWTAYWYSKQPLNPGRFSYIMEVSK